MIPVLTIVGPLFAGIGTGSFFVETIFRVPGWDVSLWKV